MSDFAPHTPSSQAVQALLLGHSEGLTLSELRRQLRLQKGVFIGESNLKELLQHPLFTALSGDRYVLAGIATRPPVKEVKDPNGPAQRWDKLLISNLPGAAEDYVLFDLETTGADTERDRIIQIAALKVLGAKCVAVRNWYVNPGEASTSLGIVTDPVIRNAIRGAPTVEAILPAFMTFIGDSPLVAHNARFDARILERALGEVAGKEDGDGPSRVLPNPVVDSMELSVLVLPNLSSYQLSSVAEELGLSIEALAEEWEVLSLDSNVDDHVVSRGTLHNAITDSYVLHRVYRELLRRLYAPGAAHSLLTSLLPEAFDSDAAFQRVDDSLLAAFRTRCDWAVKPGCTIDTMFVPPSQQILTQYLANKGYEPRVGQVEMHSLIVGALEQKQYAMVEAPTGTGKTLAYLTAAVHHAVTTGRKVALSTAYRNLQDQLLAEISDLQIHGPVAFRSQVLKGISNYVCWSQLSRYLEENESDRQQQGKALSLGERFTLAYVALWLPGSRTGTAEELSYWLMETLPEARRVVDYQGRGRPRQRGELVRPLARMRKGKLYPATPPDRVERWTDGEVMWRAKWWDELVLPQAKPDSPTFRVVAVYDPRYEEPSA